MLFFVIKIFVISTLCVIPALAITYKVSFNYWKKRNVCTWKPTFPFGNAKEILLQKKPFGFDTVELYNYLKSKSLKYGGYYIFTKPVFIPVDMDLIKKMFINDFEYFSDRIAHVDEDNDPLSANVFYLTGDRWQEIRTAMMPFVSSKKINEAFSTLKQCGFTLVEVIENRIKQDDSLDLKDVIDGYVIDLTGAFFLKFKCDAMIDPNATFKSTMNNLFNKSFKNTLIRLLISLPGVTKFCRIQSFDSKSIGFFRNLINSFLEDIKQDEMPNNILTALLSNKTPLTKSEFLANITVLFWAGYATVSGSVTFCLYELALNQNLQDSVRNEIRTALESQHMEYTYSILENLSLLGKCVKETLRKYPMFAVVTRLCKRDYSVPDSDLVLNKGTHVYMPIRAVHWDDEFYPNPEVFDPERFAEENDALRPSCAWIPFGTGPRHCLGYKLGNTSVKLCLAVLLQNYKFYLHSSSLSPMEYCPKSYVLKPKEPIRFIVEKIAK